MTLMVIGLVIFFGIHLLPTQPDLKRGLINRFGTGAYKGAFTVLSLVGLALIVYGYGKLQMMPGKNPQIWVPPTWMAHISLLLMVFSMILLVAAYVPSNIKRIVQHPMLAAVKIWALAHLLANGDLASMILFTGFLAYAVYDRISVKRRQAAGELAVDKSGGLVGDIIVLGGGLALYVAFVLFLHEWLFGVAPVTGMGA